MTTRKSSFIVLGDARSMPELRARSVDLVVTSPPYYHLKDYGVPGQIGFGHINSTTYISIVQSGIG